MTIVPAQPQDEAAIKALLAAEQLPTTDIDAASLEGFFVLRSPDGLNGVVGLDVDVDADVGLLRSLVVPGDARGRGLGQQLVAAAEASARRRGLRQLYLLTTTADRFFDRLGYRRLSREEAPAVIRATSQFATLCPSTSVLMTKTL